MSDNERDWHRDDESGEANIDPGLFVLGLVAVVAVIVAMFVPFGLVLLGLLYLIGVAFMMHWIGWNWTLGNIFYAVTWPVWAVLAVVVFIGLTIQTWT